MITAASPARLPWRHAVGITMGLQALAVAGWLVPASVHIVNWSASRPSRVALLAPRTRLVWLVATTLPVSSLLIGWRPRGGGGAPLSMGGGRMAGVGPRLSLVVVLIFLLSLWAVPYLPWIPDRVPLVLEFAGPIRW